MPTPSIISLATTNMVASFELIRKVSAVQFIRLREVRMVRTRSA
jgi:hypothetical protein